MTLIQIGSSFGPHGIPAENSHKESVSAHGRKVEDGFPKSFGKRQDFFDKTGFHKNSGQNHKRKHGRQKGVKPEHKS